MKNAICTALFALAVYLLASAGILAIWIDESGFGFHVYPIGGYYFESAAL